MKGSAGTALLAVVAICVFQWLAQRAVPSQERAPKRRLRFRVYVVGIVAAGCAGALRASATPPFSLVVLIAALTVCWITDVENGYVFDVVTGPVVCVELAAAVVAGAWESALQGAVASAAVIAVLYVVTRGRGIGLGDLKLAACIGAALGPAAGVAAIGAAFVIGALHSVVLLVQRRISRGESLRFAPYMALGFTVSLVYSQVVWS